MNTLHRAVLSGIALFALAGCAGQTVTTTTPATATSPAVTTTTTTAMPSLASITQNDLAQAIAEAQAATPPDTEAVMCYTYLRDNLALLNGQIGATQAPVGVVSAFETARLAVNNINGALSPAAKTAFQIACAPLGQSIRDAGLTLASQVTALVGALGMAGVPPILPVP